MRSYLLRWIEADILLADRLALLALSPEARWLLSFSLKGWRFLIFSWG